MLSVAIHDFEFAVADFALAAAGLVSVPVHGTYTDAEAAAAMSKVGCQGLMFMLDHAQQAKRAESGRWSVQGVKMLCPLLSTLVVMDACSADIDALDVDGKLNGASSCLDFVAVHANAEDDSVQGLPDHPVPTRLKHAVPLAPQ